MKRLILFLSMSTLIFAGCSKNDDNYVEPELPNAEVAVLSEVVNLGTFSYKTYYPEVIDGAYRGLIILAHGDGGSIDDATLNDQCHALAQQGFVAATTSYREPVGTVAEINNNFYADIENVFSDIAPDYGIPLGNTVLGGMSRGGNLTYSLILPGQEGIPFTVTGIRGAVLECSGGDEWKGSAVVVPVAFMSNQSDDVLGMANADDFLNGLQANANAGVTSKSGSLIIPGTGHCGGSNQYKAFLVNKMIEWFPM